MIGLLTSVAKTCGGSMAVEVGKIAKIASESDKNAFAMGLSKGSGEWGNTVELVSKATVCKMAVQLYGQAPGIWLPPK